MKTTIWIALVALLPAMGFAQPAEEVPPPPPEGVEQEAAAVPTLAPVAEPVQVPAPEAPEDRTIKGVTIAPAIGIYPIGYDSVNITGGEGSRYFFSLKPQIGISTAFKTGQGRVVDFEMGYALEWREYYNKKETDRDFQHEIFGGLNIPWTDRLSTSLSGYTAYFYKAGPDTSWDNALYVDTAPTLNIKATDELSLRIGYYFAFLDVLDWKTDASGVDGDTDPPSDVDDLRRGSVISGATGFDSFEPTSFGLFPSSGTFAQNQGEETVYILYNQATVGLTYSFPTNTTLKFDYKYHFEGLSNLDSQEWRGHYITPAISQKMPWEGGSVSVKNELRLRKYKFATVDDFGTKRQRFRNRTTFVINQAINEFIGFTAFYRLQLRGQNNDDYETINNEHWFFTGVNIAF